MDAALDIVEDDEGEEESFDIAIKAPATAGRQHRKLSEVQETVREIVLEESKQSTEEQEKPKFEPAVRVDASARWAHRNRMLSRQTGAATARAA